MTGNMGSADQIVRSLAAVAIAGLYLGDRISGMLALVLGTIAGALLFSGLVGWCPVYAPLGISTRGKQVSEGLRG
jgi:hypothetical protein